MGRKSSAIRLSAGRVANRADAADGDVVQVGREPEFLLQALTEFRQVGGAQGQHRIAFGTKT